MTDATSPPPGRALWSGALRRRLRSRDHWVGAALLFAVFLGLTLWTTALSGGLRGVRGWFSVCVPLQLSLLGLFWASPLPWQWAPAGAPLPRFAQGLAQALGFALAWSALVLVVDHGLEGPAAGSLLTLFTGLSLLVSTAVLLLVGYLQARLERTDLERQQAQTRAREAQARLLQNQLHPHVLFNSLNALAELIVKDPAAARESVRSLAGLMKKLFSAAKLPEIPLAEERIMVEDYLALEAIRLGPRLDARWEWEPEAQGARILPLLLQPLVENAIKHGISPVKRGGQLWIRAQRHGPELRLEVWNTGRSLVGSGAPGMGVGIRNLRDRLALAYGAGASLKLFVEGEWTIAAIRIPAAAAGLP